MITYNHAEFIRQTIDGALGQQTTFPFEILIGEDDSNDGTRDIVLEYARRHPARIRAVLHRRRDVIHVNGRPTGRWNLLDTLAEARGKYIAYVEGDDYWTDPQKLQKQVTVLEARPDLSVCGHWVEDVDESGALMSDQNCTGISCPREFSVASAIGSTPVHPNTWMFRRFDLRQHPGYPLLLKLPAGDDPLMLMLLSRGGGYCIPETMSAYRLHGGGTWSTKPPLRKQFEMLQFQLNSPALVPARYWPWVIWSASGSVIRYCGRLLRACAAQDGTAREVVLLMRSQTVLSRRNMTAWLLAGAVLAPVHVAALLVRRTKRALAGRTPARRRAEGNAA